MTHLTVGASLEEIKENADDFRVTNCAIRIELATFLSQADLLQREHIRLQRKIDIDMALQQVAFLLHFLFSLLLLFRGTICNGLLICGCGHFETVKLARDFSALEEF